MITSARQRALVKATCEDMVTRAANCKPQRGFTFEETHTWDDLMLDIKQWDDRQAGTLSAGAVRGADGFAHPAPPGSGTGARYTTNENSPYQDPHEVGADAPSFFRDVRSSRMGDYQAAERLQRNTAIRGMETRAGDMTTVAGAGGTFAPPAWLVDQFIALARPGRVTADLFQHETLPAGVSSINLPKVASGATTAIQATQNSALSDTAMTTTSVSSGISLIGGKQIVSLQLLNQSGIPFDRVILGDLAADYAKQLDLGALAGSGTSGQLRGLLNAAGAGGTTYTTTQPSLTSVTSANSFYNKVIAAATAIHTTRYLPATAVVMHPNRWAWCLEALDTTNRPLILTDGSSLNAAGSSAGIVAQGSAGKIVLPVYLDANVTITTGAGSATNQDLVYVLRGGPDMTLWESELAVESFDSTFADQASVLFRCMAFSALIVDRFAGSTNLISGTGLVAPVL
jgi:HK97 family phage major capsid protein